MARRATAERGEIAVRRGNRYNLLNVSKYA